LEIIEVSDDGCGVPMASRHLMAMPHTTSKINSLDDIYHPPTTVAAAAANKNNTNTTTYLGFRGEALYSLANLSQKLIVATRCDGEESAQKLEFGHDGTVLSDQNTIPRKVGTTVAVMQLLQPLPVRRRDLERRLNTYRQKLVQEVTAYAIFRTGVCLRFMDVVTTTASSANDKSGNYQEKIIVASSFQNATLRETVSAVLGPKFLTGLVDFYVDLTSLYDDEAETAQQQGDKNDDNGGDGAAVSSSLSPSQLATTTASTPAPNNSWFVRGLISSACRSSGSMGSKAAGPQLLYAIHKRPVEMPKLSRLLKQTFQRVALSSSLPDASSRSANQMSVILDFSIPHHRYDINLAPDKKTVLLAMEE
jgi:DNA mismatch repair protein PMS2